MVNICWIAQHGDIGTPKPASVGIGAQDRVAIVLANGSDMASAFVTIAQAATTAPLNPSYREDEFAFYLEDLGAKAIVLKNDYNGPARQAAEKLGLIVLNLIPTSRAGEFTLAGPDANAAQDVTPTEDDVALILHTSGTTSRPKIVPCCSAMLRQRRKISPRHLR